MQHLTIAYFSNRKDPKFEWFLDSVRRELGGDIGNTKIIAVDFWAEERPLPGTGYTHVMPKPSVWQGKYRLTKDNYFAASNARNTAICLAPDGWIALVDDLSVLLPGWYDSIKRAMDNDYIVLGAYKKVKDLMVGEHGFVKSFTEYAPGVDGRLSQVPHDRATACDGGWAFGCSLAGPVEAFLKINGYDEDCDSMGGEDYIAGIMIQRAGHKLMYDPRMMTYESEELHYLDKPFNRIIKPYTDRSKFKDKDASHAILNAVKYHGRNVAPNYFSEGGIRAVRQKVLAGEPFPVVQIPQHDWRDGEELKNM